MSGSGWEFESEPEREVPRPSVAGNHGGVVFERVPERFVARRSLGNGGAHVVIEAPDEAELARKIAEYDENIESRRPVPEKPAPKPRRKPLVPIDGMTKKRAEALGWIFLQPTAPREEFVDGAYRRTRATASAEKRRSDGFLARNKASAETSKDAQARLLDFIAKDERNWQAGEYRPVEVRTGALSDQGGKAR
jgi:hypothetical protein